MPNPDSRIIAAYLNHTQSTHAVGPSASYAKALSLIVQQYSSLDISILEKMRKELENQFSNQSIWQAVITKFDSIAENTSLHVEFDRHIYYDEETHQIIIFHITLQKTLAWVSQALLDKKAYGESDEGIGQNLNYIARLESLFNVLAHLAMHPGMCHIGIQHEIIGLLNGVYPGIHLVEDLDSFILNTLTQCLINKIKTFDEEAQVALLFPWIKAFSLENSSENLPHKAWLLKILPEFNDTIILQCAKFGFDPKSDIIQMKVNLENLVVLSDALSPPTDVHPTLLILLRYFELQKKENHPEVKAAIANIDIMLSRTRTFSGIEKLGLNYFFDAVTAIQRIQHYQTRIVVNEAENQALLKMTDIKSDLLTYLSVYVVEQSKAEISLTPLMQRFRECEEFLLDGLDKKISDYFALWFSFPEDNIKGRTILYSELLLLHRAKKLTLSDSQLSYFLAKYSTESAVDIGLSEINRILLFALFHAPQDWTEIYMNCLKQVLAFIKTNLMQQPITLSATNPKMTSYRNTLLNLFDFLIETRELYLAMKVAGTNYSYEAINHSRKGLCHPLAYGLILDASIDHSPEAEHEENLEKIADLVYFAALYQIDQEQYHQAVENRITHLHSSFGNKAAIDWLITCFVEWSYSKCQDLSLTLLIHMLNKHYINILLKTNIDGYSFLDYVIFIPTVLKSILEKLPKAKCLEALTVPGKYGHCVLHLAASVPESLQIIADTLPEAISTETVMSQNLKNGCGILHYAANQPGSLRIILNKVPEAFSVETMTRKNLDGCSVLHCAAIAAESLLIILENMSGELPIEAVIDINPKNNRCVLHRVTRNPELLQAILDRLEANRNSLFCIVIFLKTTNLALAEDCRRLLFRMYMKVKFKESIRHSSNFNPFTLFQLPHCNADVKIQAAERLSKGQVLTETKGKLAARQGLLGEINRLRVSSPFMRLAENRVPRLSH